MYALRYNKNRDELGMLLQDKDVMELLLQAKSRAEICRELSIPLGTLNSAITRIYQVTECHSLPELIIKYRSVASAEQAENSTNILEDELV